MPNKSDQLDARVKDRSVTLVDRLPAAGSEGLPRLTG
jgi:hypothetical protein